MQIFIFGAALACFLAYRGVEKHSKYSVILTIIAYLGLCLFGLGSTFDLKYHGAIAIVFAPFLTLIMVVAHLVSLGKLSEAKRKNPLSYVGYENLFPRYSVIFGFTRVASIALTTFWLMVTVFVITSGPLNDANFEAIFECLPYAVLPYAVYELTALHKIKAIRSAVKKVSSKNLVLNEETKHINPVDSALQNSKLDVSIILDRASKDVLNEIQVNNAFSVFHEVNKFKFGSYAPYKMTNSEFNEYNKSLLTQSCVLENIFNSHKTKINNILNGLGIPPININEEWGNDSPFSTSIGLLKGYAGEDKVIKHFRDSRKNFFEGICLKSPITNEHVEIDALFIADNEVHIFEIKDYSAKEITIDAGFVTRVDKYGKEHKLEILGQVARCNKILTDVIGRDIKVINHIVLTSRYTKVSDNMKSPSLKMCHIDYIPFLLRDLSQVEDAFYKDVESKLKQHQTKEREFMLFDNKKVFYDISNKIYSDIDIMSSFLNDLNQTQDKINALIEDTFSRVDDINNNFKYDRCKKDLNDFVLKKKTDFNQKIYITKNNFGLIKETFESLCDSLSNVENLINDELQTEKTINNLLSTFEDPNLN